jgi:alkanesulfonate monooxygenase SsuD/methylene tetrahydromethanopterin reductase-like flavin-dependent oxidoreductase (luciferase family)
MKISLFQQAPYRHLPDGFEKHHDSVVTTPYFDLVDPKLMGANLNDFVDELMLGARLGYDGVAVTEHSQSSYDIAPNPNLYASILAHQTQAERLPVAVGVIGRSLGKSREPLRVAEEYAMLDQLSGGRLIAGFPIGLSYDANQNGGVPPIETRDRYYDARALIEKAWTAKQPFAWNSRFYKYGQVNLWPRPVQQPKPPIWVPGVGNPKTMTGIIERDDVFTYLSWFGPKLTGKRIFDRYWEIAQSLGKDTNPHRLAFLQVVLVSETDEQAERDYGKHLESHFRTSLGSIPPSGLGLPGYIERVGVEAIMRDPGDFGLAARLRNISYSELVDSRVAIVGSPATVRQQITEFVKEFRIGNLLVMAQVGSMPHELTKKNITLFAKEVMPHLKNIWVDEGWDNFAWPASLRDGAQTKAA